MIEREREREREREKEKEKERERERKKGEGEKIYCWDGEMDKLFICFVTVSVQKLGLG
jgi:hypothetical protein